MHFYMDTYQSHMTVNKVIGLVK